MEVLKFGGSSVANANNIQKVINIIQQKANKQQIIVVVSALSGITDMLLQCCKTAANGDDSYKSIIQEIERRHLDTVRLLIDVTQQSSVLSYVKKQMNDIEDVCNGIYLLKELSLRTKDRIAGYGELLSSTIICAAVKAQHIDANWVDSGSLIITNDHFGNAAVNFDSTNKNIETYFQHNQAKVFIAPGFVASTSSGLPTTLGRGGSDYTAAIFTAATNAACVEIWTDVTGMMTADPRLVPNAKTIATLSYQEAMELSHFGAKVIYPPTIQPVMNKQISVYIKNTFAPNETGTLIQQNSNTQSETIVTGISSINAITLISLEGSGMVGIPGFSKRLFEALAAEKINVILITQSSSEHAICVGINEADVLAATKAIDAAFEIEMLQKKIDPLVIENNLAIVALVGDGMKNHTGISGKLFNALGKNGINIRAIAQGSSERNISTVIQKTDVKKAMNVIHEAFFETVLKEINVFIAGVGNVGSKLIEQIKKQQPFLRDQLRIKLKVAGIANSKKYIINEDGIALDDWQTALINGTPADINEFNNAIIQHNLRNSVFVDVTANNTVATTYPTFLAKAIAVVACNKVACSADYASYKNLKLLSKEYNAPFLFETNVGAGLPIIGTLNDLISSGDKIHKMEAVLSGTLNFVFNNYDGTKSFAAVVKQAQLEGYTEPDPRLDLGGKDVMRKLLILARENGDTIEMDDIANHSFMPAACMEGTVDDFYNSMEQHEQHFKNLLAEANTQGCKLKFVASYNQGKAIVGLQHINPQHNLYHLYGKDNVVLFYTERYPVQPLVIKGAGAGADVTASGIFADIIRTSKL
ncbi:bifunctional aspartate kinase/homoserine dehydrogenase I [Ferruginibacter yonginensis]|uniref:Bifunctional aspartate kinase/homoserine dehydrogenase I n=1 Tax=Ferruginibacter yonginensis TaxID=1310416 RepID=A0ABV8QUU7_9BACT